MLKLLFLIFLFLMVFAATSVLGVFWRLLSGPRRQTPREKSTRGEEMVRDPECGMFLPRGDALAASINGTTHYFCSKTCRDRFRDKQTS